MRPPLIAGSHRSRRGPGPRRLSRLGTLGLLLLLGGASDGAAEVAPVLDRDASIDHASAPIAQLSAYQRVFVPEARKAALLDQFRPLPFRVDAAGSTAPLEQCQAFLENFRNWTGLRFVEPVLTTNGVAELRAFPAFAACKRDPAVAVDRAGYWRLTGGFRIYDISTPTHGRTLLVDSASMIFDKDAAGRSDGALDRLPPEQKTTGLGRTLTPDTCTWGYAGPGWPTLFESLTVADCRAARVHCNEQMVVAWRDAYYRLWATASETFVAFDDNGPPIHKGRCTKVTLIPLKPGQGQGTPNACRLVAGICE